MRTAPGRPSGRSARAPAIAGRPPRPSKARKLWIAWDSYATGAYQVYARQGTGPVAARHARREFFRAPVDRGRRTACPSSPGRNRTRSGARISPSCSIRAAPSSTRTAASAWPIWTRGDWKELAAPVDEPMPAGIRRLPAAAAAGRRRSRPPLHDLPLPHIGRHLRAWITGPTTAAGTRSSPTSMATAGRPPSRCRRAIGRNGMVSAIALRNGNAYVAWPTDNRIWPGQQVRRSRRLRHHAQGRKAAPRSSPAASPIAAAPATAANAHPNETADIAADPRLSHRA